MFLKRLKHKNGHLVLIGGAEDRTQDKLILRRTIKINNASRIAVIPTASKYARDAGDGYIDSFRDLGVSHIDVLDIRYRDECDRPTHLETVKGAELIFFTGGDQARLVEILSGSKLIRAIKKRYAQGATIAGTSAGAAAASNPMIYAERTTGYGVNFYGYYKHSVVHREGFGFLKNVTIDTHFLARNRLSRLVQFICSGQSRKGIGLDEDTAIIVSPDNKSFEVIGSSLVTVLNGRRLSYTNYHQPSEKTHELLETNGIMLGYLGHGSGFDLVRWKVIRNHELLSKAS